MRRFQLPPCGAVAGAGGGRSPCSRRRRDRPQPARTAAAARLRCAPACPKFPAVWVIITHLEINSCNREEGEGGVIGKDHCKYWYAAIKPLLNEHLSVLQGNTYI